MLIHPDDTVDIHLDDGQKYAARDIRCGEPVIKYGFPIGEAIKDIQKGEKIGPHNLRSLLDGICEWRYEEGNISFPLDTKEGYFTGYLRPDGRAGIRNELWIVPTVGCINGVTRQLAHLTGAKALTHPYGCSQLGADLETTRKTLAALIRHPNAGGVLVLGLGCENNLIDGLMQAVDDYGGTYDKSRIRYLEIQKCGDEIEEGLEILSALRAIIDADIPTKLPLNLLKIGVKCGGSDGYSGITANPLIGQVAEEFALHGASILMTEIPEVFGAEEELLSRASSRQVFDEGVAIINGFRRYYLSHGEKISENPSPGNIAGGITTLEEKSLGCVQKGGRVPLMGVCGMGEYATAPGLTLVDGPGNDMVAVTNLMAAGANLILFSTGRGTPLSAPVPTLKISTNSLLAQQKPHWIDFDAGRLLNGSTLPECRTSLFSLCLDTLNGTPTKGESNGYYDIAIFKTGVTL